jgi:P-type E1-E2 ATPase
LIVTVGSQHFLEEKGINLTQEVLLNLQEIVEQCASPLCVAINQEVVGILGLTDPVRPTAARVLSELRALGIREIVMVTGDRVVVASDVARRVMIDHFVAEAFPAEKLEMVKHLQKKGYTVAVVGDGINDSPALAQADVGIAVNGGIAMAQEAAGVVLLEGDLEKLVEAIRIARGGIDLIQKTWNVIKITNTAALGLGFIGAIGPVAASLISDGAALAAGLYSLRPVMFGLRTGDPVMANRSRQAGGDQQDGGKSLVVWSPQGEAG